MHVSHLEIRNFRAIDELSIDFSPRINVIVGPNGVGKTTILQAMRLLKAIVAARTQQEALQVLISLGAASQHFPQNLFLKNLARDPNRQIEIRCTYRFEPDEIVKMQTKFSQLVQNVVLAQVGQNFQNPVMFVQFLQSDQGQLATQQATTILNGVLAKLQSDPEIPVGIAMDCQSNNISALDPVGGALVAFLDQSLPPSLSVFSYFPADRALPMGEVPFQLGGPDAQQQLEMHNSQPQIKYQRLKTLLINSLIAPEISKNSSREEFETIFAKLLKGRKIKEISINELGLLSIITEEIATGRLVELDGLSSGEKNIALTFLIVANSVAHGGIALFDEPELHLNPAVSQDLLPFMLDQYSIPKQIQFVMCTHSPEILSGAFSSDDCALLHLKSASDISRVGRRALDEYSDALHRLGTSVSESLLYEGTIFVEGDDDVTFIEQGFPDLVRRYKVRDRGGRREIEKVIKNLQALEVKGQDVNPIYLIFDKDDDPTTFEQSNSVRFVQWDRRALENYMLEPDIISQLLRDESVTRSTIDSEGFVERKMRAMAMDQLDAIAARQAYGEFGYLSPNLTKEDLAQEGLDEISSKLFARASAARETLNLVDPISWQEEFLSRSKVIRQELELKWESKWRHLCDGKRMISDMHKAFSLRISESAFRIRIISTMRDEKSDDWRIVNQHLTELLKA